MRPPAAYPARASSSVAFEWPIDGAIPSAARRAISSSAPDSSGAIVITRSPSRAASMIAGSSSAGVRRRAGSWAPLRAGAMNGPSRLKPSGSAPPVGAWRIHERTRSAKRGISASGSVGAVGRNDVTPCLSSTWAIPVSASASPVASWPPQPWQWTSMNPGATNGPDAASRLPGSGTTCAMNPSSITRCPGTTSSPRTSRPSTSSATRASSIAARMARMFSAGTLGWMLWTAANTNPPPGARSATRRWTSARTSAGVPAPSTRCVSTPPPQKTRSRPNSRLSSAVSIPAAETCTGLRISTPISTRSGISSRTAPQVWKKTFAVVRAWRNRKSSRWSGLTSSAIGARREQRPVLAAEVVGLDEDVRVRAHLRQRPLPVRELDLQDPLHHAPCERGVCGEVHVPVLEAAELEQPLAEAAADGADGDGTALVLRVPAGLVGHPGVPGGVGGVRPRVGVDRGGVDLPAQRRRERVVVQPPIEWHPAPDAPLVGEDAVLRPPRGSRAGTWTRPAGSPAGRRPRGRPGRRARPRPAAA